MSWYKGPRVWDDVLGKMLYSTAEQFDGRTWDEYPEVAR